MIVSIMDSDFYVLQQYEEIFDRIDEKIEVQCYTNARSLWIGYKKARPDIIILESESPGSNSILNLIRIENPKQNIILTAETENIPSDYSRYFLSGIIVKPLTEDAVRRQLFRVRHPIIAKIKGLENKDQ